ncbi:hypothetical protein [Streptomyces omiyaensis]|uniref:hypothetical protein n=1 Tax=Streptomyces omiyaensis TaxID=68247 RepID=UPI00167BAA83|nr:hypothetical protein [Streptomyces omiyaensis]
MDPFVASAACLDISQTLYRALYRVQATHLRGHDPGDALAALASVDPERVKIPDTEDGLRLRAALRGIQAARNLHPHP